MENQSNTNETGNIVLDLQQSQNSINPNNQSKSLQDYFNDLIPHAMGGAYINFMMNEDQACIKSSYKVNYKRLAEIKNKFDPTNFFHINQNIQPA